jgi:hypothetical protein
MEETLELPIDPSRDIIEFPMEIPPIKRKLAWGNIERSRKTFSS